MPRKRRSEAGDASSLIDWSEPEAGMHVLDWRERAQHFGVMPGEGSEELHSVVRSADRLLEEEEPEALDGNGREEHMDDDADEASEEPNDGPEIPGVAGASREDIDLVRVYLRHVGKRKLLKAKEEQAIGQRIESARGQFQATLGTIPCVLRTLFSLADNVKRGTVPAAELILLPDGGELKDENIRPTLEAFARIRRAQRRIEERRKRAKIAAPAR